MTETLTVTANNWTSFEQQLDLPSYVVDVALWELGVEGELAEAEYEAAAASDLAKHAAELAENPEYDSKRFWQTGEEAYRSKAQDAQQRLERVKARQMSSRCNGARHRRAVPRPAHHRGLNRRASHGGKTVRCGSRRVGAGTRAGPDDEGELPSDIGGPLPIGGRR